MNRLYITITLLALLLSSCKNVQKMVDKGNYNEAISYAVKKLEGQKDKKTKYVKALERAYEKVNTRDLDRIAALSSTDALNRYDKIYDIYQAMSYRQATVQRLIPLVSEDGYVADFTTANYVHLLQSTAQKAAENHYQEALRLLTIAEQTDKYAAREAYQRLSYIEAYFEHYKDTKELYRKAYQLGLDHVGVSIKASGNHNQSHVLTTVLSDIDVAQINRFWTQYYIGSTANIPYDYQVTIELDRIDPGLERENYHTYTETREIEDGTKPVRDLNGNIVKDTLGNTIYTKKYKTITAEVTEVIRSKQASVSGRTVVYNNNNESLVKSIPIHLSHLFEDFEVTYRGDKRALSNETKRKLGGFLDRFPTDYDMIVAMTSDFKDIAYGVLENDIR